MAVTEKQADSSKHSAATQTGLLEGVSLISTVAGVGLTGMAIIESAPLLVGGALVAGALAIGTRIAENRILLREIAESRTQSPPTRKKARKSIHRHRDIRKTP